VGPRASMCTQDRRALECNFGFCKRQLSERQKCHKINHIRLCSGNNHHYSLIFTTPLFYILAPTCFGSSLPSVVVSVVFPSCMHSAGKHNRSNHDTLAHRPRNHTLCDLPPIRFVLQSNSEGSKKLPDNGTLLPKHVGASI
jgi:hypothetical protein